MFQKYQVFCGVFFICLIPTLLPTAGFAEQNITLGALLSLTGGWSSLGLASQAALSFAIEDINTHLGELAYPLRFHLLTADTKLDPATALLQLQALASQGVKVFIGPQSSAEVQQLKSYADEQGLILISQGSTAHALAITNDNVFRFCPDDVSEGQAAAALMWADGMRTYVSLNRSDTGNMGLQVSTYNAFIAMGGGFIGGVRYGVNNMDFGPELAYLNAKISAVTGVHDASTVGVYASAFDEIADCFNQAGSTTPGLSQVKWYGSDGVALSSVLVSNPTAAAFAAAAGYPNPMFGLDRTNPSRWQPIFNRIKTSIGFDPDAFALAAYDAAWVAAQAYVKIAPATDAATLKASLPVVAATYEGVTGRTTLNEAGDRLFGDYDFWAVRPDHTVFAWKLTASYDSQTGEIQRWPESPAQAATLWRMR